MTPMNLDTARSYLMEEDIAPLSALEEDAEEEAVVDEIENDIQQLEDEMEDERDGESVGLGVDIVEIDRMRRILQRRPAFAEQVFSPAECEYCRSKADPPVHFALRFAAKEAVVKALGTGFSEGIWVRDIEVEKDPKGRPLVKLLGRAEEVAREQGIRELSISMSYTRHDAVACAMAITEESLRASEKRKDPMEELAKQFKETRKWLDEI